MTEPARALAFAATVLTLVLAGCASSTGGDVPVLREVTVSPASLELAPGERAEITVSIVASGDIGSISVTWSSDLPSVATVESTGSRTGTVTAEGAGNTTVTARVVAENTGQVTREVDVTVTDG